MILKITTLSTIALLGACAVQRGWEANQYKDEFTGATACRIELGHLRPTGFYGMAFLSFYAENRNGEVRAGVHAEPAVPIAGDVQLKVGETIYTLTSQDAPLDLTPSMPDYSATVSESAGKEYAQMISAITKQSQQMISPYRAFTGAKAVQLLKAMASTQDEVMLRTIGVNTASTMTGKFKTGPDFEKAVKSCGISI